MKWILENKEWLFSGLGIFIVSLVIGFFMKKSPSNKQIQKSGDNSTNFQASGDIKIGRNNDK